MRVDKWSRVVPWLGWVEGGLKSDGEVIVCRIMLRMLSW